MPAQPIRSVHPRLRGELFFGSWRRSFCGGSSPLARGTPDAFFFCHFFFRFIPACAGNSRWERVVHHTPPVHPRLRGELIHPGGNFILQSGSSPLARGTLLRSRFRNLLFRFIPACAGNSRSMRNKILTSAVHPRLRGELSAAIVIGGVYTRFIPACAGNSRLIERLETELAVHPRLRGELTQKSKLHSAQCGSSPLARGTPILNARF